MEAPAPGGRLVELARTVVTLALVVGTTAALLSALDAVPRYLLGEPRGIRAYATVEDAERRLRARLYLPAYFPDTIRWPPVAVRVESGPPPSVALTFVRRDGVEQVLFLLESFTEAPRSSSRLLPAGVVLQSAPVAIGAARGEVTRLAADDGRIWQDVTWALRGRRLTLRFRGELEEALRMARSVRP